MHDTCNIKMNLKKLSQVKEIDTKNYKLSGYKKFFSEKGKIIDRNQSSVCHGLELGGKAMTAKQMEEFLEL